MRIKLRAADMVRAAQIAIGLGERGRYVTPCHTFSCGDVDKLALAIALSTRIGRIEGGEIVPSGKADTKHMLHALAHACLVFGMALERMRVAGELEVEDDEPATTGQP